MTMIDTTTRPVPSFAMEKEQGTFSFFSYDPKQEYPAPEGARLVNCLYRSKAGKQAARPNEAMFIPDWITADMIADNMPQLVEYFISFLQDQEQEAIREKHKACTTMIGNSQFQLAALLEYMTSKGAGARLSGELIGEWYKASGLAEALEALYMEKTGGMVDKSQQLVEFIGKKLQSLASPKTVWTEEEKQKLVPILESADSCTMRDKLLARVNGMAAVSTSLLDAL